MKDLMLIMSEAIPEEFLFAQLEKHVVEFRLTNSQEAKDQAKMMMMLIMSKEACEKEGGADKLSAKLS